MHSKHTQHFKRQALALAIAAASLAAQAEPEQTLATVTVVGQAASLDSALGQQTAADNITAVVHADAIGKLPDTNAAEALQRLPGVSIERDQGEGRYVRVRGLGPAHNSVTVNGSLLPSPEADTRAVAMDVVPASVIQSLTVVKTLTPDMDANSIGGTVEIKTRSAFDHKDAFQSVQLEGSYDENSGETSPKVAATWSDRLTDHFGMAFGLSWESRDFGSDNVETGGAWDFDENPALLEEAEMRDYTINRERLGTVLNLDWQYENSRYFLRTLYSKFNDSESRQGLGVEFADAQAAGATGEAEATRALKDREENSTALSLVLGTQQKFGLWTLDAQAGYGRANEKNPSYVQSEFTGEFDAGVGFSGNRKPVVSGPAGFYDAAEYELDTIEESVSSTKDQEKNIRFDLSRDIAINNDLLTVKFGAKTSRREKTANEDVRVFEDFGDQGYDLTLADFQAGTADYALGRFGPAINGGRIRSFLATLDANAFDAYDETESRINDFTMHEDIHAGYLQAAWESGPLRLLGGLRYEATKFQAQGTGLEDGTGADGFVEKQVKRDDDHLLPGLHLRYEMAQDTVLRAAWSNSVVRPSFEQLRPGYLIEDDDGDITAEFGNPELKALESANFDLSVERRLGRAGLLSAALFYKDIKHFAYRADLAGTGQYVDFDEAITFVNGDKAEIQGLELAWSQTFGGFLVGANATLSDSDAKIASSDGGTLLARRIALPSQSDTTANLMLGYENKRFGLRLAANYKSEYLLEVANALDARYDAYVDEQTQLDFSAYYNLGQHAQLTLQALNLSDEPYYVYTGRHSHNGQYEEYGPTYKLGLTLTQF